MEEELNHSLYGLEKNVTEVSATRTVSGEAFAQGVMDFNISIGAPSAFKWSETYFRVACTVTQGTRQPSLYDSSVALAENFCATMFNQIDVKAGGVSISSQTRYLPQADQLRNRLSKSYAWQQSVGRNAFLIEPSFDNRRLITSGNSDGSVTTAGTIAVAEGGQVTGSGTDFWDSGVRVGMILEVGGDEYAITSIQPDSSTTIFISVPVGFTPIAGGTTYKIYSEVDRTQSANYRNRVYALWRPGIGIFNNEDWMGAGQYTVSLNPAAYYGTAALQTLLSTTNTNSYKITVDDIRFYVPTYKVSVPSDIRQLNLMEWDIQSKVIGTDGNVSSLQFTVPSSTRALAVFLQAGESGYDMTNPPTLFKTKQTWPPVAGVNDERSLQNIQITYGGISRPSINWSNLPFTEDNSVAATTSTNQLQQRYYDVISESGMLYNVGGCESFEQYLDRGLIIYYDFLRDVDNKSTDVQLSANFGANLPPNTRLFCCALYSRIVEITTQNGLVVNVRSKSV